MSATEPRQLRADARRNRERIVAAARRRFAEHGAQAQMDDVAREAGVGVGTVYRHFPTKDALVGAIMRDKFERIELRARRWAAVEDGWEAFEGFVRESAQEMAADAAEQRMMWVTTAEAMAYAEDARLALVATFGQVIDRAHAQGTLRDDFGSADMGPMMCALGGVMSAGNSWEKLLEILLDGLRKRG